MCPIILLEFLWSFDRKERMLRMEVKITGGQAVYKNMMNSIKGNRPVHVSDDSDKRISGERHQDEIVISGDGIKKQEAAQAAQSLYQTMGQDAKSERIAELKQQVQDGTYRISSEVLAGRMLL